MSYFTFVILNGKARLHSEQAQGTDGLLERLYAEGSKGGRNYVTILEKMVHVLRAYFYMIIFLGLLYIRMCKTAYVGASQLQISGVDCM